MRETQFSRRIGTSNWNIDKRLLFILRSTGDQARRLMPSCVCLTNGIGVSILTGSKEIEAALEMF